MPVYCRLPGRSHLPVPHLPAFPHLYRDALRVLRRASDAFGAQRIMWAEALYYVVESDQLSESEKEWVR